MDKSVRTNIVQYDMNVAKGDMCVVKCVVFVVKIKGVNPVMWCDKVSLFSTMMTNDDM